MKYLQAIERDCVLPGSGNQVDLRLDALNTAICDVSNYLLNIYSHFVFLILVVKRIDFDDSASGFVTDCEDEGSIG